MLLDVVSTRISYYFYRALGKLSINLLLLPSSIRVESSRSMTREKVSISFAKKPTDVKLVY